MASAQTELFATDKLECSCCHKSATKLRRLPGEPVVMAISTTITRKGSGKSKQRAARAVRICEECFIKARHGDGFFGMAKEARELLLVWLDSLSDCYSALLDEDGGRA